jgi:hypothetical protein
MRYFMPLSLSVFVCACGALIPSEVYLIPSGMTGDVYIVTGVGRGAEPTREGRAIVFRIPETGILVTQDEPSPGWHLTRYCYVDAAGERTPLEDIHTTIPKSPENLADSRPFVWFERRGEIRGV